MFVVKDMLDEEGSVAYFENRKNAEKYHCIEHKNFFGIEIFEVDQLDEVVTLDEKYEQIPFCFYTVETEGETQYFDDEAESLRVLNNHINKNLGDIEGYSAEREECYPAAGESYYEAVLWWQSETVDGKKYTKKYSD